ncbi:unnamed protein product, partial [Mesorhabditis belari]|uniref:Uncharacterized protein n=1 Tax=Mesorhabditis belari TaxID=2138241 RepID=A0AAF3F665_9BILA
MEIPVDLSGVNLEWIGQGASGSIFLIDSFEPAILLKHITTRADTRRNEFLIEPRIEWFTETSSQPMFLKVFDRFGSHYDYGLFATEERQLIDVEVLECEHGIRFIVEKCTIFDVNKRSRVSELMVEIEDLYKQDEDAILMNVKPIDSPLETRLIKPIGFDRTKRRVSVGHSDLFNIEIVYENTQNSVNSVQSQASTSAQAFVENSSQILATMEQILEENKEIRFLQQKTLQHIEAQQQKMQDFELKLDQLQNQEQKTREKVEHHERTFYNKGAPTGYPAGILDSGYPKNATTSNEYFCENYEDRKCMVSTSDRLTPPLQSDDLIRYASSGNCTHPPQTKTSNSHYNASPRTRE